MSDTDNGQESLVEALSRANAVYRREAGQEAEAGDDARQLGDLRAGLAVALGMIRKTPGPNGLTVLTVPSDAEIVQEIYRLRSLAAVQQESTAADAAEPT